MEPLIKQRTGHWYQHEAGIWSPMHDIMKKDGSGLRPATLKDARKLGLYPSVTAILDIMAKPLLTNWLIEQAILASVTLPRINGETTEAFVERVVVDMDAQSEKARSLGTMIHDGIEQYVVGTYELIAPEARPYLAGFIDWAVRNITKVHFAEKSIGHTGLGYAGRLDLFCELAGVGSCVVDFKTQGVKRNTPVFYPEWPKQIAAYAFCVQGAGRGASVIIDSATPGAPVAVKVWDDLQPHRDAFEWCLNLWKHEKDYDPRMVQRIKTA